MLIGIKALPDAQVGMQWEICDAIKEAEPPFVTDDISVAPPFKHVPVKNPAFLQHQLLALAQSPFPPESLLAKLIGNRMPSGSLDAAPIEINSVLGELWTDRQWWSNFVGNIDLDDLRRPEKGLLGLEKRRMPAVSDYPEGMLRRYQAMRVNWIFWKRFCLPTFFLALPTSTPRG